MRHVRLSTLFHSVGAAKIKNLSKKVLEQFLLSGGITNNKSSLAERVFVELLLVRIVEGKGGLVAGGLVVVFAIFKVCKIYIRICFLCNIGQVCCINANNVQTHNVKT